MPSPAFEGSSEIPSRSPKSSALFFRISTIPALTVSKSSSSTKADITISSPVILVSAAFLAP